jgi:hypothetical protein
LHGHVSHTGKLNTISLLFVPLLFLPDTGSVA